MGTRYSAIENELLSHEDKIACGMIPFQEPSTSKGNALSSFLEGNEEVVDLQR